jgi:hypothetical protein
MNKLRFTGTWPPLELWNNYPNWEYALDEEGSSGQDETTLRPSGNSEFIDDEVVFTTGDLALSDGRKLPAMLELMNGEIVGVTAFTSNDDGWSVRLLGNPAKWTCIVQIWLPSEERSPFVLPDDSTVFPAFASSRLISKSRRSVLTCHIVP